MPGPIEYEKVMTETVYINLPTPPEPSPRLSGMEILHGFLGEFYQTDNKEVKEFTMNMCAKWNIHYRLPNDRDRR
jgi:hypothetical protein